MDKVKKPAYSRRNLDIRILRGEEGNSAHHTTDTFFVEGELSTSQRWPALRTMTFMRIGSSGNMRK